MATAVVLHVCCIRAWMRLRSSSSAWCHCISAAFPRWTTEIWTSFKLSGPPVQRLIKSSPSNVHPRGGIRSRRGCWLVAVEDEEVAEEEGLESIIILWNISFVEYHCVFGILQNFRWSFWNPFGIFGISLLFAVMKVNPSSCLCPVLLCLCFLERGYEASHHGQAKIISRSHNATHSHNQTKDGETEVHHRPKRGWIWNQFFVLEEHIGPDAQYVGKVSMTFSDLVWSFPWSSLQTLEDFLVFVSLANQLNQLANAGRPGWPTYTN